jgi:TonB-linked SusC/RagA family outer membrane protein
VAFGTETSLEAIEGGYEQWRNSTFQAFLNYDLTSGSNRFHAQLGYNLDQVTLQGEGIPYKTIDFMGRFTYAYNTKYIGELSFDYGGANGYAEGKGFGLFPAISLGWIASNEEFLKGSRIVNYLKVKGSYGISGNNYLGAQRFLYEQYYDREGTHYFGAGNSSMAGYAEAQIANPDLTWEKEKEMNIGFEAVLAQKLNIGFDLFQQNRIDILAAPNDRVPQFLGGILPKLNVGEVKNTGFEAMVGYTSDQSSNFQFFVNLSAWYAKNEIVFMSETPQEFDYMYRTGRPVDQPFLLEDLGFFQNQSDINGSPEQLFDEVQPGDLKYKDQNGDGVVDESDRYPTGYTDIPELSFSLNGGLTYKIIYLDLLFHAVTNRSVYLTGKDFYAFQDDGKVTSWALDRWNSATANAAEYPRLSTLDNQNNFQPSTFWQRDGSFIKLRYAELGVKLPVRNVERIKLSGVKIFLSGTNLFSLDKVDLTDPEILSGYPAVRSVCIGTKIQF